jgi:hypothetical protein
LKQASIAIQKQIHNAVLMGQYSRMGGYGSGRQYGRPTADASKRIDIAWMVRTGLAVPGRSITGRLSWTSRGEPAGNISYTCDMRDLENAALELRFTVTRSSTGEKKDYVQRVTLTYSLPHFGGRRWWMYCPINGERVGKLYCPNGGDIFASRSAWRLGYHSQRITDRDRPFEALFRLQKRLGCSQGWEMPIRRPKGMWRKTYERLEREYLHLDRLCGLQMMAVLSRLNGATSKKKLG